MTSKEYHQIDQPRLGNQYLEDSALQDVVKRLFPSDILSKIETDLEQFGDKVVREVYRWGKESENNPPRLVQIDAWGSRVDDVIVAPGWKNLQELSAKEGIIAISYERKFNEWSRLYQIVKLFLFAPASAVFGCPLAMTDGAARLLELHGAGEDTREAFEHLISRDPSKMWTSGQWMTEKTGGSDVGNSETVARLNPDGTYSLTGYKYFTSSSTSEMAILLARIQDEQGKGQAGSRGLSTFLIKTRKQDGDLNNLIVHKLKNKLGTKAVPTAEMELRGSTAKLIGKPNQGVKVISTILNITRIYNAVHSAAAMRRGIAVARDYALRRQAFGKVLSDQPLHNTTLADMEIQYRAALQFILDVGKLLGRSECDRSSREEEILLRLLTPLLKLYTAKQAIAVTSECIECLGGTGFMEDSDMPRLLRDSQVGSIWEGTTNILSLDVWRPIRSEGALELLLAIVTKRLNQIKNPKLSESLSEVRRAFDLIKSTAKKLTTTPNALEPNARYFAYGLARAYMALLLLEHAEWKGVEVDIEIARRWCQNVMSSGEHFLNLSTPLLPSSATESNYLELSRAIALDLDPVTKQPRVQAINVDRRGITRPKL